MKYKSYVKNHDNEYVTERYVFMKFNPVKRTENGYRVSCPFNNHEEDIKKPAFDIKHDGRFNCFKCKETGNLIKLAKHFGDDLRQLF